jgi:2-polyprenyl-3-methyl-5-hydroxy-6-metoxy-1,4-benzoquinol methylase
MTKFDKFYFPDASVLKQQYDFICSTEVIEHLRDPSAVFTTLFYLLKKQGTLAVMTKMVLNRDAFSKWHYIQDQSHICFYSRETMYFLAAAQDATLQFMDKDVIFFHKDRFLQ